MTAMMDTGETAGAQRLDEMLLRSARFGEVQSKLDAILAAIGGPARSIKATPPASAATVTAPGSAVATPAATSTFPQARRELDAVQRPAASAQRKAMTSHTPEDPIADRIARLEDRLAGLSGLEASVNELVSRFGTIEATHVEPIRQAALVEVRYALAAERAAADAVAPTALAAVEQVQGELTAVKKAHTEEAQRLRSILESLSSSLERVAVRLEDLEEGATSVKPDAELRGTMVDASAYLKRPLPQPATRRRPLLETIGLSRRRDAFA